MRALAGLFLALSLLFAPPARAAKTPRPAASAQTQVPVRLFTSPSGVSAWVVSDATVPMLVLSAYWKGGAAGDPKGLAGLASMTADMMTEGAGTLESDAFKVRLEELNMSLGFSAGWDGVSMDLTTLTKNRDAAFEMARLALMEPRFDPAPLARIKRQAVVAIKQRETNPGYLAETALNKTMIPGHPYAEQTSLASVAAVEKSAMIARRRAIMARDNLQITVVGDVDDKTLGALLDKVFGALPAHASAAAAPDVAPRPGPALVVRRLPQPQSVVAFQGPGIGVDDPDWVPLAVANYILGGGDFSSRLMAVVREREGLVYGISTAPRVLDHADFIRGVAQTKNATADKAIGLIKAEMKRLHDQGATPAEVADAKTYLTGSFALALDGDSKIAGVLQSYQTTGRPIDYINKRNALINAVTVEQVNAVAKRLFDPDKFVFVVVGEPDGMPATP